MHDYQQVHVHQHLHNVWSGLRSRSTRRSLVNKFEDYLREVEIHHIVATIYVSFGYPIRMNGWMDRGR